MAKKFSFNIKLTTTLLIGLLAVMKPHNAVAKDLSCCIPISGPTTCTSLNDCGVCCATLGQGGMGIECFQNCKKQFPS